MRFFRRDSFHLFAALFAFFVIGGDLVADGIHDASGACSAESQSGDHAACPACGCSLHVGAALASYGPLLWPPDAIAVPVADRTPLRIVAAPAKIDHPPQLG